MWSIPAIAVSGVLILYRSELVDTGVEGSGDDGGGGGTGGLQTIQMDVFRECSDRVMMPCDSEEFITVCDGFFAQRLTTPLLEGDFLTRAFGYLQPQGGPGICDLLHCGNNFCSDKETPCRIESTYNEVWVKPET